MVTLGGEPHVKIKSNYLWFFATTANGLNH